MEAAESSQQNSEKEARARRESVCYADTLSSQQYGPMHRILIPVKHSRTSTYPLLRKALSCRRMAREVDFEELAEALAPGGDVEEIIPIDMVCDFGNSTGTT